MSRSIYIIAGEVSGDTHGAELMHELQTHSTELSFHGAGGPLMRSASSNVRDWLEGAAVMGLWEVLFQYKWFKKQQTSMLQEIHEIQPEALILIDYPGYNLRFARLVSEQLPDTKIIYYISPQVWAWNKGRIYDMASILDKMLCILPFEKALFEKAGLDTSFVGHPLVDELAEKTAAVTKDPQLIGLFPGSREREITRLFPMMLETARRLHTRNRDWKFQAPAASPKLAELMHTMVEKSGLTELVIISEGDSHQIMQTAHCGCIASGTATLEAAYFGLPYCLVYKTAWPTYLAAKLLVKIKHIGLVNVLADETIVEEFIQGDADPCHVERSLEHFLTDHDHAAQVSQRLLEVTSQLGEPGVHLRAAKEILTCLGETSSQS